MNKGTIVYIGNFELPDKNAAAHRVINNGKLFKALGYRVVYLGTVREDTFNGIRQSDYDPDIYEEAYPRGTKQWIKHIFDTTNLSAVVQRYPDTCLIIPYNLPFATFRAIQKTFRHRNIAIAYDCTEWNGFAEGSLPKKLYKKWDEVQIRNRLGKYCKNMIVISNCMQKKYKYANLLKLPPLVDLEDAIWQQTRTGHTDVFEFCFAGTTSNKDLLDVLISAFAKTDHARLRLRIIGTDKREYLKNFPEHTTLLNNDDRILFMGRLPHEETVKHILNCDCYIFIRESTRRNEAGFPTKFSEAFTCGVPVISTDVSDINEFADNRVILLNSTKESAILAAVKHVVGSNFNRDPKLNGRFDYRNYLSESDRWLSNVLK